MASPVAVRVTPAPTAGEGSDERRDEEARRAPERALQSSSTLGAARQGTFDATSVRTTIREELMGLGTILLIVLILMLVGVLPTWPHSQSWGYGPSGLLGVVVLILLILVLTGRL